MLSECGATPVFVRTPDELDSVSCLCIPGGESTTIAKLARQHELVEPLRRRTQEGMPIFGTCAGMIVMAKGVRDGEPLLSVMDIDVSRNAYGRQVDSFEADVDVSGIGPVRAVSIRAPRVERIGPEVEVLAEHGDRPVLVRQGNVLAAAFHPEIAGDPRIHGVLLSLAS